MLPYDKRLKSFSRSLRSHMTDAERCLWRRIRNRQISGLQFYRQKPLLEYIVDFYCPKAGLVIELDGAQHLDAEHRVRDAERDAQLAGAGLQVLRFDDRQVLKETEAVVNEIYRFVKERLE